ncbi:MAG TPA: hypothetical protein VEQ65_05885 [Opitutus sp.]|nr:hypothetical protein [Opitutus sp.]
MYPARELAQLAERKAGLRQRIAMRRLECWTHAENVARPIALFERIAARWRAISPIAKAAMVPLGFMLQRKLRPAPGGSALTRAMQFLPLAMSAARLVSRLRGH